MQSQRPLELVHLKAPIELFLKGTTMTKAHRDSPTELFKTLLVGLADVILFMNAKETLKGNDQLIFTVEVIIDKFPTLKVEEILYVFNKIKSEGRIFERLKTPEIVNAISYYDSNDRAEMLEQYHARHRIEKPFVKDDIKESKNHKYWIEKFKEQIKEATKKPDVKHYEKRLLMAQKFKERQEKQSAIFGEKKTKEKEYFTAICEKINSNITIDKNEIEFMKRLDFKV